jgi:ATP-dependent Clp protease ATP-binding subunit ClpB
MFEPLSQKEIASVVEIQLKGISNMLSKNGVEISFSKEAIEHIAELGYDPEFGARPVKRVIQRRVLDALSRKLLEGSINRATPVKVDVENNHLVISN